MRPAALLLSCFLLPTLAHAKAGAPDIQQWKPVADVGGFSLVQDASTLHQLRFGVGFSLNYAVHPLEVQSESSRRQFGLIDGIVGGDLWGSFGIFDWWEVEAVLPMMQIPIETAFVSSSAIGGTPTAYGIGDLWIGTRLRVLDPDSRPIGFAVNPFITLPTGTETIGLGRGKPAGGVRLAVSRSWTRVRFAFDVGYTFLPRATVANLTTGDEFTYGAAVGLSPVPGKLDVNLELSGSLTAGPNDATGTERFFDGVHSPLEFVASVRGHLSNGMHVGGGVTKGLTAGFGTPALRLFAEVSYGVLAARDPDKDGLVGKQDQCPKIPEDFDAFQDNDGCPDPDNDADGILDPADGCANQAEDVDRFQDQDGCPDPDNDLDQILDAADGCPEEAEDKDEFQDTDGCPDPDNDGDTILDAADRCPNQPEEVDGWKDDDGCPDPDDDLDLIPDPNDLCPREPEDRNGIRDDDGCPDSKLAVQRGDKILIFEKVYFATNKDTILRRSDAVLAAVAGLLKNAPTVQKVRVEGHTDDVGNDAGNQKLSQRRAEAVVRALVKLGVGVQRLEATGYGEARPVAPNSDEPGRERNRRVEFAIPSPGGAPAPPAPPPSPGGGPTHPAPPPLITPPAAAPAASPWGAPAVTPAPPSAPARPVGNPWGATTPTGGTSGAGPATTGGTATPPPEVKPAGNPW